MSVAAAERAAGVIAPRAPARRLSYSAPELGYPGHACRACGRRPCAVRLAWSDRHVWLPACQRAFFCVEHVAEANRAYRILKAGAAPPGAGGPDPDPPVSPRAAF